MPNHIEHHLIPVWINIATISSKPKLLEKFIMTTFELLREYLTFEDEVEKLALHVEAMKTHQLMDDLYDDARKFFGHLKLKGWRCILILEEFDALRILFKDDYPAFQMLRELGSLVSFVTASRRSIETIERESHADISNLHSTLLEVRLGCFDDTELTQLLKRLEPLGMRLTADHLDDGGPASWVATRFWPRHSDSLPRLGMADQW